VGLEFYTNGREVSGKYRQLGANDDVGLVVNSDGNKW